jgi:hypothetical protein
LPITSRPEDYAPGDLIRWDLGGNLPHIGVVVDHKAGRSGRYLVVHNIGQGPKMEDALFNWKITGHYRYFGPGGMRSARPEKFTRRPADPCQNFGPAALNSSDFPRGMVRVFQSLDRRCLARNTICPICAP